jgi:three-Cys-motif partner protein
VPTARSRYYTYPTDGLPARVVKPWSEEKLYFVDRYMDIFANGMRRKWKYLAYVDLFAGPGVCVTAKSNDFHDGSPLRAFRHPFTHHVYVDLDRVAVDALRRRTAKWRTERVVEVIEGDCNAVIDKVIAALPERDCLVFAFIDPTNWQIRFETVQKLVSVRRVDVLLTFHVGHLKRVADRDQPEVDAFIGRSSRECFEPGRTPRLDEYARVYREQMVKLGYLDRSTARDIKIKNSKNALLYTLPLYSRHPLAFDFFDRVSDEDLSGQLTLLRVAPATERERAASRGSAASPD